MKIPALYILACAVALSAAAASFCRGAEIRVGNPLEILGRAELANEWQKSVGMEVEVGIYRPNQTTPIAMRRFSYYCGGNRLAWRGGAYALNKDGSPNLGSDSIIHLVYNGKLTLRLYGVEPQYGKPSSATITRGISRMARGYMVASVFGGFVDGWIDDNGDHSAVQLLRGASGLAVRKGEGGNGEACVVVTGNTPYGQISGWFSPSKNFEALQWKVYKSSGSVASNGKTLASLGLRSITELVEVTRFSRVGGYYIPSEGSERETIVGAGPNNIATFIDKVVRSNIRLSPPFDQLKAFDFDIPNGVPLSFPDQTPGISYVWRNGKAVPDYNPQTVATIDKDIKQLPTLPGTNGGKTVVSAAGNETERKAASNPNPAPAVAATNAPSSSNGYILDMIVGIIAASGIGALLYWAYRKKSAS
jgi:hypothetical protein